MPYESGSLKSVGDSKTNVAQAISRTHAGESHWISFLNTRFRRFWFCSCHGFTYRGTCWHIKNFTSAVQNGYTPDPGIFTLTAVGQALLAELQEQIPRPVLPCDMTKDKKIRSKKRGNDLPHEKSHQGQLRHIKANGLPILLSHANHPCMRACLAHPRAYCWGSPRNSILQGLP